MSLLPACISFHYGKYDVMLVPLTVFATSINYWRKPTYGCRRNMDIGAGFVLEHVFNFIVSWNVKTNRLS